MTRIAILIGACLLASCAQEEDTGLAGSAKFPRIVPFDPEEPGCTPYPEIIGDGQDQDCSGWDACYQDLDEDGFGTDILVEADIHGCGVAGKSVLSGDCQDNAACGGTDYYPGNPKGQACGSGEDFDCDAGTCGQDTNCGCGACEPI